MGIFWLAIRQKTALKLLKNETASFRHRPLENLWGREEKEREKNYAYISNITVIPICICRLAIHFFHIGQNAPCLPPPPPNFARPLFSISPGYYSPPKEKLKTMGMQNLGGGGVNTVHSGLCEKSEWPSDKCI